MLQAMFSDVRIFEMFLVSFKVFFSHFLRIKTMNRQSVLFDLVFQWSYQIWICLVVDAFFADEIFFCHLLFQKKKAFFPSSRFWSLFLADVQSYRIFLARLHTKTTLRCCTKFLHAKVFPDQDRSCLKCRAQSWFYAFARAVRQANLLKNIRRCSRRDLEIFFWHMTRFFPSPQASSGKSLLHFHQTRHMRCRQRKNIFQDKVSHWKSCFSNGSMFPEEAKQPACVDLQIHMFANNPATLLSFVYTII